MYNVVVIILIVYTYTIENLEEHQLLLYQFYTLLSVYRVPCRSVIGNERYEILRCKQTYGFIVSKNYILEYIGYFVCIYIYIYIYIYKYIYRINIYLYISNILI